MALKPGDKTTAMRTASPWWFSAIFAAALLLLFLGERAFDHIDGARLALSGLGALGVLGITGLRVFTFLGTSGERRAVERMLLFCHLGVMASLALFVTTTEWGHGLLGIDASDPQAVDRFQIPMTVIWSIGLFASLIPMLMIEASLGTARRSAFLFRDLDESDVEQGAVEAFRVREMAGSGLSIALAAAFLMVTCNVADQRNVRVDVSYFKTSSPGSATVSVTREFARPVRVLLFFPRVNETREEVEGYFRSLQASTDNIAIEEYDQLVSPGLAKKYGVNNNGTVVLAVPGAGDDDAGDAGGKKGEDGKDADPPEKHESFTVTIDTERRQRAARTELRELDSKVNTALMKLRRERRVAYLTVGHGELNDASSVWAQAGARVFAQRGGLKANRIKETLRNLNFQVKDLGLAQGLSSEVPDDASLVLIMGPMQSLLDEETAALDRYLARGGRVLIALDPLSQASLGALEGRLGLRFNSTALTDDKLHARFLGVDSDKRWIITDRFSSHASITTLTRAARAGILMVNAGSFEEVEFEGDSKPKRTMVVKSRATTFADADNNFQFDKDTEKREQYNLVAAVEDSGAAPAEGKGDGKKDEGMRAMVFSDVEIFSDYVQERSLPAAVLFGDAVKWLGGEEHLAGEIVSEKDVYIEHTQTEDVLWFYLTIIGAPLVILGFGLWFGWWRRHRMQRRAS